MNCCICGTVRNCGPYLKKEIGRACVGKECVA